MLTDMNLDHENFEELVEEAKNRIASDYPEWTDFNYHDPGITISELFAFLKEIAQYRMNYIGEEHQLKYLRLLGRERKRLMPARAQVQFVCREDCFLPEMTRCYAAGICFENLRSRYLIAGDIAGYGYWQDGKWIFVDRQQQSLMGEKKIPIFGETPREGQCFYVKFSKALPVDCELEIYGEIFSRYPVLRTRIEEGDTFLPLAQICLEVYGKTGWNLCEEFVDGTYGFLQNGWLRFRLNSAMEQIKGQEGYWLRFRLVKNRYDIPPILTSLRLNVAEVVQRRHLACCMDLKTERAGDEWVCRLEANEVTSQNIALLRSDKDGYYIYEDYTVSREGKWILLRLGATWTGEMVRALAWESMFDLNQILGEGNGLPCQEYEVADDSLDPGQFRLMVGSEEEGGLFREWEQVEDFAGSAPSDRHYILDTRQKKVIFGDCIHGRAPEGSILIIQYVTSEGSRGNVKAGKIHRIEEGYEQLQVTNEENAEGGMDEQSLEDCFMEARRAVYQNEGLVTDGDYEEAVRCTPGLMVENCRVLRHRETDLQTVRGNRISLVVKPFSYEKNPRLSAEYSRNIQSWLEERRMLGTQICLLSPEYVKLHVFVECKGRNNYLYDREKIREALGQFFRPYAREFGGVISHSEVYELLDRLEMVETLEALSIDAAGSRVSRNYGGDIVLPPNGLISQEDIAYDISIN